MVIVGSRCRSDISGARESVMTQKSWESSSTKEGTRPLVAACAEGVVRVEPQSFEANMGSLPRFKKTPEPRVVRFVCLLEGEALVEVPPFMPRRHFLHWMSRWIS